MQKLIIFGIIFVFVLIVGTVFVLYYKDDVTPDREADLFDEDVLLILEEFAEKDWWEETIPYFAEQLPPAGELLLASLNFKNEDVKTKIKEASQQLDEILIADEPQARAFKEVSTQLCLAESIVYDDLKNTVQRCGYEPAFSFESADDLTAVAQVIPFFVNGLVYYYEEQHAEAERYFEQINLHRSLLDELDYVDFTDPHFELYNKIYNKTPDREVLLKWERLEHGEERRTIEVFDPEENLIFQLSVDELRE